MRVNDLFDAFDGLDGEMLYEARACTPSRRHIPRRIAIAAAVVLMAVGVFVIYGIFLAPVSAVYLESRESVTITLNSCGNVLSAGGYTELSGKSVYEAVDVIVGEMLDSGAVNADENTLLIGADRLSDTEQVELCKTVQDRLTESRFRGATVSLSCSDTGVKNAVADHLANAAELFAADALTNLSANDLNILLHEYDVSGSLIITGEPSESGYIGKAAALTRAKANTEMKETDTTVTYSVYQDRLVYLVRIIDGDRAEAYFIGAADGAIVIALKTTSDQLEQGIRAEVKRTTAPDLQSHSVQNAVPQMPQSTIAVDSTQSFESVTQQPTIATNQATEATILATTTASQNITEPSVDPAVPTDIIGFEKSAEAQPAAPTDQETTKPTETPSVDINSLIVRIPHDQVIWYSEKKPDHSYGQGVFLTPFNPFYHWRMNWLSENPLMKKAEVIEKGKLDKSIAVFCTYDDFATYYIDSSLAWSEYYQTMRNDDRFNKDFFRENALVMVWYTDYSVYTNEVDSISAIEINGETAFITVLRKYRMEAANYVETDVYRCIVSATVKKSDIKNVKDLKLIVITQSEKE